MLPVKYTNSIQLIVSSKREIIEKMNFHGIFTWIMIDIIIPKTVTSRNGTIINQTNEDINKAHSHMNAAATKIIIRIGS